MTKPKTGIACLYYKGFYFTSIFTINSSGFFICISKEHFNRLNCLKGINNSAEEKLFFNELWEHKPHTKSYRRKNNNSNSPYVTVNNLNISHFKLDQDLNYYCKRR